MENTEKNKRVLGFEENTEIMKGEIKSLTALRFFAAFYVSLFHVHNFSGIDLGIFNTFLSNGYLAVDFFFILSGFILAYTYHDIYQRKQYSHRDFIIKRLARIYPVHIFCLALICMIYATAMSLNIHLDVGFPGYNTLIQNMTLTHAWATKEYTFNEPSWSISAEFFVYLIFSLLLHRMLKIKPFYGFAFSILTFLSVYAYIDLRLESEWVELHLVRVTSEFIMGIALYLFFMKYTWRENMQTPAVSVLFLLVGTLCCKGLEYFTILLFIGLIFLYADMARKKTSSVLEHPLWNYLGRISYSFYMMHYCIWVGFLHVFLGGYLGLGQADLSYIEILSYLALTTILFFPSAMIVYHLVEVPSRKQVVKTFTKSRYYQ